jgi:misacylated tRNA(Ala) deacylase
MTRELFREDGYLRTCEATVVAVDERGIVLDATVFYPEGGGQPGDIGVLGRGDGGRIAIVDTRKDRDSGEHLHVPAADAPLPAVGETVIAQIDWDRRHRLMRMHTCLHLLCAVVEGGVTGGSVGTDRGRLDFDLPDQVLDKDRIEAELNRLIAEDHPLAARWIADEELAANPDLVRTMSVRPPSGQGRVRVIEVAGVDLQPCGGTHVHSTGEVGRVRVGKIEKKGRHNRRVNLLFAD